MPAAAAEAKLPTAHIDPALVARFADTLDRLGCETEASLAIAVSGGADSTALLLLAAAARPGAVVAATVDHGLRLEAVAEAQQVAGLCAMLGVPHSTLPVRIDRVRGGPQASARKARYDALAGWCPAGWLLTGHQRDDVAETILMRLSRGSGVRGLARMSERSRHRPGGPVLLRPLLDWARSDLLAICARAGVDPVEDPSNADTRFDRTRARELLAAAPWLESANLARSAANLAEADAALEWLAERCWLERVIERNDALEIDAAPLPHDTRRRLVERSIAMLAGDGWARDRLDGFVLLLAAGHHATLAGVHGSPGPPWRLERAPPRRETAPSVP